MRNRLLALSTGDRMLPNIPPDIAAEVRLPNDRPGFREAKIARYRRWGVPLVLDVDPVWRTIIAHDVEGTKTYVQSERFSRASAPWLAFDVAGVFVDIDKLGL